MKSKHGGGDSLFKIILAIHIFFGIIALLTFWIPLFAKKGQSLHIRGGKTYITAMCFVALTASLLCSIRLLDPHSTEEQIQFAWFLFFISLLASSCAWYAIRVWRFQSRTLPHYNVLDIGIPLLLFFSALAISAYGLMHQNYLFTIFPLIGIFLGGSQLYYWLSTPKIKNHAWFQHMAGMFSCVISTLTAFAVVGFPKLLHLDRMNWLLWFGPSLIMVPILILWQNYYKRKFNPPSNPSK